MTDRQSVEQTDRQTDRPVWRLSVQFASGRTTGREGDEEADRRHDGKTTSESGLALNGIYYYVKPRTVRSGGRCAPTVSQSTG